MNTWRSIKPGWYLLALLLFYAVFATVALSRSNAALREARRQAAVREVVQEAAPDTSAPSGLWFPIPGASLPQAAAYLPGAPRSYRQGVNQGFDFYGGDVGVPVEIGTPVVAAADGKVVRADLDYQAPSVEAWRSLMADVAENGASAGQLDTLRGRQVWIETDRGLTLRYGHLSAVASALHEGARVYRGQVIGYVGNSGTDDGILGTGAGARLHFEVWRPGGSFWGEGLSEQALRLEAASLFTGP